jgi:hypothetical protein
LAVGLKVDGEALPPELIAALQAGQVDLTNPAVTIELLRLNVNKILKLQLSTPQKRDRVEFLKSL